MFCPRFILRIICLLSELDNCVYSMEEIVKIPWGFRAEVPPGFMRGYRGYNRLCKHRLMFICALKAMYLVLTIWLLVWLCFCGLCWSLSSHLYAGGGLPGDGEHRTGDGDAVWSSVWEGHRQRRPLDGLQRAAVGGKESGDRNSLGSSQLDSLLKPARTGKGLKGGAFPTKIRFF